MSESPLERADQLIEMERVQIGNEIHDALLPLIFGASAGVSRAIEQSKAGSPDLESGLVQVAQWLDDAMQAGRRILSGIYSPELVGTLWIRAAQQTLANLDEPNTSAIDWQIDDEVNETTRPIAMAAYRIVVEATRNAIRHGKPSRVVVKANKSGGAIRVVIWDDGNGFDKNSIPDQRYGIRVMRGRAELVGGSLTIESQPGGPTQVVFAAGKV